MGRECVRSDVLCGKKSRNSRLLQQMVPKCAWECVAKKCAVVYNFSTPRYIYFRLGGFWITKVLPFDTRIVAIKYMKSLFCNFALDTFGTLRMSYLSQVKAYLIAAVSTNDDL